MAKKCMIERELKRQLTVDKFKKKRQIIQKSLKKAANLNEIFALQRQLQRLPVNSSMIRLRNRCWKTGRSRGFYRDFGLSRHVLRKMTHECLLPGIFKSSW
jgi:small subunit ribosomal protein S14|tara:strand:+ start:10369 stop:10671 length:303 start_codon:yes stop_codon:yes gene_type:complete